MSADVIDIDTPRSGEQKRRTEDALFMALWALAGKFAAALGAGIALPLLESSGFRLTTRGVEGLGSLSFLYVAFPIMCRLVAAACGWLQLRRGTNPSGMSASESLGSSAASRML